MSSIEVANGQRRIVRADGDDRDIVQPPIRPRVRFATDAGEQVNKMLVKPHDESIYWVEIESRRGGRSSTPRLSLSVAPLRVGPMMEKFIRQAKDSVVLTSATIQTDDAKAQQWR